MGNLGFGWNVDVAYQSLLKSSHNVVEFNAAAMDIVKSSDYDIQVLDYFWLSYARPDNTQVKTRENEIGPHLGHPGRSVNSILTRKILMMTMWSVCSATMENWTAYM